MNVELDDYLLRKWARVIKVRNRGVCLMCGVEPGLARLQVHHVYPKSIYPARAYDLDNGVCLCLRCHMGVVHAENSFVDLSPEGGNWRRFVVMFRYQMRLKTLREFNEREQHRIARKPPKVSTAG